MIKRGLYYARVNRDDPKNIGIVKKCIGQVTALRRAGFEIDIIWLSDKGIIRNDDVAIHYTSKTFRNKFFKSLFYFFKLPRLLVKLLDKKYDFTYIRFELAHPGWLFFLKSLKKSNLEMKIILELPTHPYRQELNGISGKIRWWIDMISRINIHHRIHYIVHYGNQKMIWKIPAISLQNGIDFSNIPVRVPQLDKKRLNLLAIGNWNVWHGLDRLVNGLAKYQKNYPELSGTVNLIIAGEGMERKKLISLVEQLNLQDCVFFRSAIFGNALDELFDESDMGIGSLGLHRIGLSLGSPLKHREYCARGLPFLLSCYDPGFALYQHKGILQIPDSEDDVDIARLLEYYYQLDITNTTIELRQYAMKNFGWETIMEKVIKGAELSK